MPTVHKRVKKTHQPKWFTTEIKNTILNRDKLKNSGNYFQYKFWRNKVVSMIRKAKRNYYIQALETNTKNPRVLWKYMKDVCPDKDYTVPNVLKVDNQEITDTKQIASTFNSHFSSLAERYIPNQKTQLDSKTKFKICNFVNEKMNNQPMTFCIKPISSDFILKQIKSMNNSKATGLDGIGVHIIKIAAPAIVGSLTRICNLSIESGEFPSQWKQARVTPIFKTGSKDNCSNYRPISVLPILSKILEKHVFNCLYEYLQERDLLIKSQFGFRKNHCCQTALIALTEKIYEAFCAGKLFGLVQLDFSKAFDLINHSLLIEKLKLYRADQKSIDWFTSYLDNRTQKVILQDVQSESNSIKSGVPQGSILGPLLFLLFINDLPLHISHCDQILYADDATITFPGKTIKEIEDCLAQALTSISEWCEQNDMILSIPKSSSMLITTKQRLSNMDNDESLSIQIVNTDTPLQNKDTSKILGVHIDQFLTWNSHIKYLHNKVVKNLYLLRKIKPYLPLDSRKLFYNSYILPLYDYCSVIWGNCSQTLLNDLFKLQKRAARLILDKDWRTRSHELFCDLEWMPLMDRISYMRAVQVYKCLNNQCSSLLDSLFQYNSNVHRHNTRSAVNNDLFIPRKHHKSFSYIGAVTWNSIPPHVRNAKKIDTFKKLYKNNYNY
jgi:hypothetical protein